MIKFLSIKLGTFQILAFEQTVKLLYEERKSDDMEYKKKLQSEINQIDWKITKYINRIWKTESEALVASYEKQIENLEVEKLKISNNLQKELKDVWTPLKKKMKLVRNAFDIWKSSSLENKKALIKNIFPEWIPINEKKQVWTPTFSLVYQAFSLWKSSNCLMVEFIRKNMNKILI